MSKLEYRVRKIERFIVTEYTSEDEGTSVSQLGTFDNESDAKCVARAMVDSAKSRDDMGFSDGDTIVDCEGYKVVMDDGAWVEPPIY